MLSEILIELFERDLAKLQSEIEAYTNEGDLWAKPGDVPNSAGNLCLHLNGNLQHFIGGVLGGSCYFRDRDLEFSAVYVPRGEMLAAVDETASVVRKTLTKLTDDDFAKTFPLEVLGKSLTTGFFLAHLTSHLSWHLGQISYHRQVVASSDYHDMQAASRPAHEPAHLS